MNGNLTLYQSNTTRTTEFIASTQQLNATIELASKDLALLANNATYVLTYWFLNCVYLGQSSNFTYLENFTKENAEYELEALVVGSYDIVGL